MIAIKAQVSEYSIEDSAQEAIDLATRLDVRVETTHKDFEFSADRETTSATIRQAYIRWLESLNKESE